MAIQQNFVIVLHYPKYDKLNVYIFKYNYLYGSVCQTARGRGPGTPLP
jgi:hypothetical protein